MSYVEYMCANAFAKFFIERIRAIRQFERQRIGPANSTEPLQFSISLSFFLAHKPNERDDFPGKSHFFHAVNHSLARGRCPFANPLSALPVASARRIARRAREGPVAQSELYDRDPLIQRSRGSAQRGDLRWCLEPRALYADEPMNSSSLSVFLLPSPFSRPASVSVDPRHLLPSRVLLPPSPPAPAAPPLRRLVA